MPIVGGVMSDVETRDPDAPPVDRLQPAFQLPEHLREHSIYGPLYTEMVARLRREASGIQMSTIQTLLIERIASLYVYIRWCEDDPTRWSGVNGQKQSNDYWLALTHEFYAILSQGEDKRREQLIDDMEKIVLGGLDLIEDSEMKKTLRNYYESELAAIGQ